MIFSNGTCTRLKLEEASATNTDSGLDSTGEFDGYASDNYDLCAILDRVGMKHMLKKYYRLTNAFGIYSVTHFRATLA